MERTPPSLGAPLLLASAAAVFGVVGTALYSQAAPYVGFLDLARTALPGLALASGAVVVALLGRGGSGPPLLTAASIAASAPAFGVGLQQRSAAWAVVTAAGAAVAALVVAVALVFPHGRVGGKAPRVVIVAALGAAAAAVAVRVSTYDPASWNWCECVANPIAVGVEPRTYLDIVDALTVMEMAVLATGVVALAAARPRLARPDAAFVAAFGLLVASWLLVDGWKLATEVTAPGGVTLARDAALVLLPVLYASAYAARRPSRAHVADLLLAAREQNKPSRLRDLVARAIGDPRAEVAWWDPASDGFRDHLGRVVAIPDNGVLAVEGGGRRIAVVLSEGLESLDPGVRDSVGEALLLSSENRRLTAELQSSLEQVRDSRARIVAAGDDTRRRIERDLHDGAQQLLISTGIKLNLAAAQVEQGDTQAVTKVLEEAQAELNRALTELRSLASGIAPTSLVHGSLDNALRELALRSPVPTTVRVTGEQQPDEHAAATVYFVVAECLTNVAKHADASRAAVEVALQEPIAVVVQDDGRGGATLDGNGTGLRGLLDRVESRGGRLVLESGPDGTSVSATVPTDAWTPS